MEEKQELAAERWTLTAEFDPFEVQQSAVGYDGSGDEAEKFVEIVRKMWDNGIPEDMNDLVVRDDRKVSLASGYLGYLEEPLRWLIDMSVPVKITVERNTRR